MEYTTKWSKGLLRIPSRYIFKAVVKHIRNYKYIDVKQS